MLVSSFHLREAIAILDEEGIDADRVLARAGLTPDDLLKREDDWMHVSDHARLSEAMMQETLDPAFGLVVGFRAVRARASPVAAGWPDGPDAA